MAPSPSKPPAKAEGTVSTLRVELGSDGAMHFAQPGTRRLLRNRMDEDSVDGRTIPLYRLHGVDHQDDLVAQLKERRSSFSDGLPRFQVGAIIGEGSQGLILSVHDRDCRRDVALKTLHHTGCDLDEISRFIHEAQVTAQLEHPGIVPVHDVGVLADGTVFYTMKRVGGVNLADHLADRAGKPEHRFDLLELFLRACEAIAFAHSRGVIHRDLKPRNIMVGAFGEVLVLDWGLAKIVGTPPSAKDRIRARDLPDSDGDIHRTMEGYAVGTPAYMSPEQARGSHQVIIDQRCDVYSLGVILYEMLGGVSPYQRGNVRKTLEQVARGEWKPLNLQDGAQGMPRRLVAIVHKALAAEVTQRYQSVPELIDDLRNYLSGLPVRAYRETPMEVCLRHFNNHRKLVGVAVGTAVVAAILVGVWRWTEYAAVEAQTQAWFNEAHGRQVEGGTAYSKSRSDGDATRKQDLRQLAKNHLEIARRTYEGILKVRENDQRATDQLREIRKQLDAVAEDELAAQRMAEAESHENRARRSFDEAMRLETALTEPEQLRALDLFTRAAEDYQRALGIAPNRADFINAYQEVVRKRAALEQQRKAIDIRAAEQAEGRKKYELLIQQAKDIVQPLGRAHTEATDEQVGIAGFEKAIGLIRGAIVLRPSNEDLDYVNDLSLRMENLRKKVDLKHQREAAEKLFKQAMDWVAKDKPDEAATCLDRSLALYKDPERERKGRDQIADCRRRLDCAEAERILAITDQKQAITQQDRTILLEVLDQKEQVRTQVLEGGDEATIARLAALEQQADQLGSRVAQQCAEIINLLLQADTRASDHPPVRRRLAAYYVARLLEAEQENRTADVAVARTMAQRYDGENGDFAATIRGEATITCAAGSLPVRFRPITQRDGCVDRPDAVVATLEPGRPAIHLPRGRYLLEGIATNGGIVTQAREFMRGDHITVALRAPPPLPSDMVYIPAGQVRTGSGRHTPSLAVAAFALGRHEVTCGDWLMFLNDPAILRRYEDARARGVLRFAPRISFDSPEPLWRQQTVPVWQKQPGEFLLVFRDGDRPVDSKQPVTGISFADVQDYLVWLRARDRIEWRLPTAAEWMLAAQGGEGRTYPWGNQFGPRACASGFDLQRWPKELRIGTVASDRSVQGVQDLAGSVSEFCSDTVGNGLRTMMGGNYTDRLPDRFSSTCNRACDPRNVFSGCGFRLALTIP